MHGRPRMKRPVVQTWLEKTSAATTAAKKPTYGGSRKLRHRFEYSPESKSAFVELVPSFYPSKEEGPQKFKAMLEEVAGVVSRGMANQQDLAGECGRSLLRAESARLQ